MSAHTGASALLALLILSRSCGKAAPPYPGAPSTLVGPAVARAARNAIRRLLRAHDWKVDTAAAALGVSGNALCAAGAAVGLKIRGRVAKGRPRIAGNVAMRVTVKCSACGATWQDKRCAATGCPGIA